MSDGKITFYLRGYDRDRVIELLEQKRELMKEMIASHNGNDLDRFGQALEAAKAPLDMIERARRGYYDDVESELATPIIQLVRDAEAAGLKSIADQAKQGEFDATEDEMEEWYENEGRHIL